MPAPIGNQNAAKGKLWHGAIVRALRKRSKSEALEELDNIAEKLIAACNEGDLTALKELGDRLDGKPSQTIEADITARHAFAVPVGKDTEEAAAWVTTTAR